MKNKQIIEAELKTISERYNIKIGQLYQHFKGNYYMITDIAVNAETNDMNFDIIFKDILYPEFTFRRSFQNFISTETNELGEPVKRFKLILDNNINLNIKTLSLFADMAHAIWSNWIGYSFSKGYKVAEDGSYRIPKEFYERWTKQSETKYENLSDEEKKSDIDIAIKYLKLLEDNNVR